MENCIFCKIVAGELPSHIVYQDTYVIAFLDINPITRGHTLIIPKKHAADIFEINETDGGAIMQAAQKVARAAIKAFGAAGINLLNSNKKAAGQVVFHYHMHVIPRYDNDGVRLFTPERKEMPDLKTIREQIKNAL